MPRSRLLIAVSLLLFTQGAASASSEQPLASGFTAPNSPFRAGMWWNPELDGSGMDIHLSGEQLFLVWYTYEPDGAPVWYLAVDTYDGGDWSAPLERYTWSASAGEATGAVVGEVGLSFDSTYRADFEWSIDGQSGSYPIEPLLVSEGISRYDRTGHWFNAGEPGYGITFNDQGSVEFAVVYLYDDQGQPRWVFGQRTGELMETLQLLSFEGACPSCDYFEAVPTAAGSLTREFDSFTRGTLTLDVTLAEPVTGEWQRQSVPIRLLSDRQDGRNHPAAMARFASDAALEQFLKEGIRNRPRYPVPIDFSPAPPGDYSRTTIQVTGVDEADSVKTDGRHLYAIGPGALGTPRLRVLLTDDEGPGVDELASVPLEGNLYDKQGLYLVTDRDEGLPDLLVAQRGTGNYEIVFSEGVRVTWASGVTQIQLIDVSDPAAPGDIAKWTLEGHLVASRRIGEKLYVVTRHTPEIPGFRYHATSDEDRAHNDQLLSETTLGDLLPDIRLNSGPLRETVGADNAWLPPILLERPLAELVMVNTFDLTRPERLPDTLAIAGQNEAVFSSTNALYLASTRYDYALGTGGVIQEYPPQIHTDIHKIRYADGGPEYRGSASVEGHLGWDEDYKPYRFGESDGVLGVVTSSVGTWGALGENRLTLLEETPQTAQHRLLTEVAHLPNPSRPARLGKPDELLYATRFRGKRAYVLTAKWVQTRFIDPLYVVDLSDPEDPFVAGSLEVTGYSGFLFPIDDNHLIGVGEDAVTDADGNALSTGLKVGLYDVSDPANPVQASTVVIGYAGSRSPVIEDPHAFSYLPSDPDQGRPARVAVPIMETQPEAGDEPEPGMEQPWIRSGLHLFDVHLQPNGGSNVIRVGQITTAARYWDEYDDEFRWLDGSYSRSVITDGNAYFLDEAFVWSSPWEAAAQQVGPE